MFHIIIIGLCLTITSTPIVAQLHQNAPGVGFQPTNNITVAKLPGATGWNAAPPPPPGGWPAPPPPPPGWPAPPAPGGWPAPTTAPPTYCEENRPPPVAGSPTCPATDGAIPVYLASTDCSCFYECSNGVPYIFDCPFLLEWNPVLQVCDFFLDSGCTGSRKASTHFDGKSVPNKL